MNSNQPVTYDPTEIQHWLEAEILRGFQPLMTLGLERMPASALIERTAKVWMKTLLHTRRFDAQRDTPRIREAFRKLCAERRAWPQPADLVLALPPIPEVNETRPPKRVGRDLVKDRTPDEERRGMEHIAAIVERLGFNQEQPQ